MTSLFINKILTFQCMLGGEWFEELFGSVDSVNENEILSVAIEAVREYLNIKSDPIRYIINIEKVRFSNKTFQYNNQHNEIVFNSIV